MADLEEGESSLPLPDESYNNPHLHCTIVVLAMVLAMVF